MYVQFTYKYNIYIYLQYIYIYIYIQYIYIYIYIQYIYIYIYTQYVWFYQHVSLSRFLEGNAMFTLWIVEISAPVGRWSHFHPIISSGS